MASSTADVISVKITWSRKEELLHLNSLYQIKEAIWKYEACKEISIVHLTHLLYEDTLSKSPTKGNFSKQLCG